MYLAKSFRKRVTKKTPLDILLSQKQQVGSKKGEKPQRLSGLCGHATSSDPEKGARNRQEAWRLA
jgi:hypothetical protein